MSHHHHVPPSTTYRQPNMRSICGYQLNPIYKHTHTPTLSPKHTPDSLIYIFGTAKRKMCGAIFTESPTETNERWVGTYVPFSCKLLWHNVFIRYFD